MKNTFVFIRRSFVVKIDIFLHENVAPAIFAQTESAMQIRTIRRCSIGCTKSERSPTRKTFSGATVLIVKMSFFSIRPCSEACC